MPLRYTCMCIISGAPQSFRQTWAGIIFSLMKNSLCFFFFGSTCVRHGFSKLLFLWKSLYFTFFLEVFLPGQRDWGWCFFPPSTIKIMFPCFWLSGIWWEVLKVWSLFRCVWCVFPLWLLLRFSFYHLFSRICLWYALLWFSLKTC